MKNLLFVILGIIFLTSCVSKKEKEVLVKTDTVIKTICKDSVVAKKDTVVEKK